LRPETRNREQLRREAKCGFIGNLQATQERGIGTTG
jgi:hypothetical protein